MRLGPRLRLSAALAITAVAWAMYAMGAADSPLLSRVERQRQAYLDEILRNAQTADLTAERDLAEIYWQRYPDVANDGFFGRNGQMGVFGAREHFERHGRREGRIWGRNP